MQPKVLTLLFLYPLFIFSADTSRRLHLDDIDASQYDARLMAILKHQRQWFVFQNFHGPTLHMMIVNLIDKEPFLVSKKVYNAMLAGATNAIAQVMSAPAVYYLQHDCVLRGSGVHWRSLSEQEALSMQRHYEGLRDGLIGYLHKNYHANHVSNGLYIDYAFGVALVARAFCLPSDIRDKIIAYSDEFLYKMPKVDALIMLRYADGAEGHATWSGSHGEQRIHVQLPEPLCDLCRCGKGTNWCCETTYPDGIHNFEVILKVLHNADQT